MGTFNAEGELYVGLSEVRFEGASPVPEPASIALIGLGGLAMVGRRRRSA